MRALSDPTHQRRTSRRVILTAGAAAAATWLGKGWVRAEDASDPRPSLTPPIPQAPAALPAPKPPRLIEASAADRAEWASFKRRFLTPEGRVIDTGNGGVSHSEGQGYGLFFAQACDDRASFEQILAWTRTHLARRGDSLHAWRWLPQAVDHVPDHNNATDADLFIAAALSRAGRRWGRPDHEAAARAIAVNVHDLLVRDTGDRLVLLPGVQGFEHPDGLTINPSYYVLPLLADLAALHPSPKWARLHADGLALLDQGRFGAWQLPPDWLHIGRGTGALQPHPNWPARFSYDAIRVPLFMSWSGCGESATVRAFTAYWASCANRPAWIDLRSNATAGYTAPSGMVAVAGIAAHAAQQGAKASSPPQFPPVSASPDYYSGALIILSRLAWLEGAMV